MKRTVEIVLTSISVAINTFATFIMGGIMFLVSSPELKNDFREAFFEVAREEGVALSIDEIDMALDLFSRLGWFVFALFLLGVILGALAIYFFAGNKKPKAASLITLITGIVITVLTAFFGFVPGILYVAAGIVGLLRKPPVDYAVVDAESQEPF